MAINISVQPSSQFVITPINQPIQIETLPEDQIIIQTNHTTYQVDIVQSPVIDIEVLAQGERGETGPKGDKGDPGASGEKITVIAGQILSGNRAIYMESDGKVYYADKDDINKASKVLGITEHSALTDEDIDIQSFGAMTDPSWNWDLTKKIYLSTNGLLTQTIPTSGVLREIGIPISTTSMLINMQDAIILV